MEPQGKEVHIDKVEARSGSTPGVVRYVLLISLVLVVIAFAIIVMTGALSSPDDTGGHADTQQAVSEQTDQTP